MNSSSKLTSRITLLPLIAATYFIVSGGPYGLEELIAKAGYPRTLFVLLLTPLVWSLPTALMVGELSSALPEQGGYYAWVRRGLGPFWGFQEAWLSLVASIFDMAIYPTLFTLYLGKLVPSLGHGMPAAFIGVALIAACALWNLAGGRSVGRGSFLMATILLGPFVLLALVGFFTSPVNASPGVAAPTGIWAGIFVAMWNYMGWDNATTFANEVDRPQRTYPMAMLATVALIFASYAVPVLVAWHAGLDPRPWSTGSWVTAGLSIGGRWLGLALVLGGMVAPLGSFNALVMSYSRLPVALAEDGYLPKLFTWRRANGAPWVAILGCSAAYACCLGLGFERLIQMDIILYGASLVLEFVALYRLRVTEPDLPRPFMIPGGRWGVAALGIAPTALLVVAMLSGLSSDGGVKGTVVAAGLAWAGLVLYWLIARGRKESPVPRSALIPTD